jgi:hypothetical protein
MWNPSTADYTFFRFVLSDKTNGDTQLTKKMLFAKETQETNKLLHTRYQSHSSYSSSNLFMYSLLMLYSDASN